jgi:hypothetical protein
MPTYAHVYRAVRYVYIDVYIDVYIYTIYIHKYIWTRSGVRLLGERLLLIPYKRHIYIYIYIYIYRCKRTGGDVC